MPYLPVRVSYKPKQFQALKMKQGREKGKRKERREIRKEERGREGRRGGKKRQLKKLWALCISFFPGESQERQSLVGCHLWGHTESDMTEAT